MADKVKKAPPKAPPPPPTPSGPSQQGTWEVVIVDAILGNLFGGGK